jgi:hypothetical protein
MEGYEIGKAAEAAGVAVAELKNWLRQGIVKYKGEEPRPSYARVFPLAGVYEIALLAEMVGGGFERSFAAQVIQQQLGAWQQENQGKKISGPRRSELVAVFEIHRDVGKPTLLVFAADPGWPTAAQYAGGLDDIPRAISRLQEQGKAQLIASRPRGTKAPLSKPIPFEAFGIVNVTAVLARVDARLAG